MSVGSATARAATVAAVLGMAPLLLGAGPTTLVAAAPSQAPPERVAAAALSPIRLQPFKLVYRHMEGAYLKGPRGVFVDQVRGEVYVADTMNDLVAVYDRDGMPLFTFGYNGEFREPMKAVVDGRGRIYVLAGIGRKLRVFNYRGEFLHDFPFAGIEGRAEPAALGADVEGNIYIADSTSGQILVYDQDQRLTLRFGSARDGEDGFKAPQAISVDRKGQIYVADAQGMPVQVFSRQGRFIRGWGAHATGPQNFSLPSGLAIDSAGRVIVVDTIRQVVSVFTPEGGFLGRHGGLGFSAGAMAYPTDVASDGDRRIYVVERVGNRLQILDQETVTLSSGTPAAADRQVPARAREDIRRSLVDLMGLVR